MKASIPVPSALQSRTLPPAGVLPTGHFEDRRPEHARQAQLKSVIQATTLPGTAHMNIPPALSSPAAGLVIQREGLFDMQGSTLQERLSKQFMAQQRVINTPEFFLSTPFTSVGFEYEFAEFKFNDQPNHPLRDVTHLEIARSQPPAAFSNLPFSVETDADNAIELVTPPFLIETVGKHPIPNPDVIIDFNELMKRELGVLAEKGYEPPAPAKTRTRPPRDKSVQGLLKGLSVLTGFQFIPETSLAIGSANINPSTPFVSTDPLTPLAFLGLKTDPITKFDSRGRKGTISDQINIATDSYVYDRLRTMRQEKSKSDIDKAFSIFEKELERCMESSVNLPRLPENMRIFLRETIRTLSQSAAIPALQYVEKAKAEIFEDLKTSSRHHQSLNKYKKGPRKDDFDRAADIRSHVKDVDGIWLKDTLFSFALGLLHTPEEYQQVVDILTQLQVNKAAIHIPEILFLPTTQSGLSPTMFYQEKLAESIELLIRHFIPYTKRVLTDYPFPNAPIPFGSHVPGLPGARHDTLIHPDKVNRIPPFQDTRLHVAEIRSDGIKRLVELTQPLVKLRDLIHSSTFETREDRIRLQEQLNTFVRKNQYTLEDIAWAWNKSEDKIQHFLAYDFTAEESSHQTSPAPAAPSVSPAVAPKREEPKTPGPPPPPRKA